MVNNYCVSQSPTNTTKFDCCCSERNPAGWGPRCERCPIKGTRELQVINSCFCCQTINFPFTTQQSLCSIFHSQLNTQLCVQTSPYQQPSLQVCYHHQPLKYVVSLKFNIALLKLKTVSFPWQFMSAKVVGTCALTGSVEIPRMGSGACVTPGMNWGLTTYALVSKASNTTREYIVDIIFYPLSPVIGILTHNFRLANGPIYEGVNGVNCLAYKDVFWLS